MEPLLNLASELGVSPASLAMALALANPRLATVLFGATRPEQIVENPRAVEVAASLSEPQLATSSLFALRRTRALVLGGVAGDRSGERSWVRVCRRRGHDPVTQGRCGGRCGGRARLSRHPAGFVDA